MSGALAFARRAVTVLFGFMLAYHALALISHAALERDRPWTELRPWISLLLGVWALHVLLSWPRVRGILTRPPSVLDGLHRLSLAALVLSVLSLLWLLITTSEQEAELLLSPLHWALGLGLLTWMLAPQSWFRRRMA
jgi:hypothetical protein